MTGTLILASLVFLCLLGSLIAFINYSLAESRDIRLRREIFKPGRMIKLLSCVSNNFNKYTVDDVLFIVDVINDEAEIRFRDGGITYKHLSNIGVLADRIEVYEKNGSLAGVYEHDSNVGILYLNFLHKKQ